MYCQKKTLTTKCFSGICTGMVINIVCECWVARCTLLLQLVGAGTAWCSKDRQTLMDTAVWTLAARVG